MVGILELIGSSELEELNSIHIHVDIHQGTDDRWVPPYFSQYLARTLPDATLKTIPTQGHFYHMAYGEETLKALGTRR